MSFGINKKYFDCIVVNGFFRIVESEQKPKKSNAALETLEKIDYILKNKLQYERTFNDNYSKFPENNLYNLLYVKAVEIKNGFQEKESNQKSLMKNQIKVNALMTRIENSLYPPSVLPLTDDATREITKHLDFTDLGTLAKVNRHGRKQAEIAIFQRAMELGYSGEKILETVSKFLNNLVKDFSEIVMKIPAFQKYFDKQDKFINILKNLPNKLASQDLIEILGSYSIYLYTNIYPFMLKLTDEVLKKSSKDLDKNLSNINIPTFDGSTPLIMTIRYGKIEMLKLLIQHKADVNFPGQGRINQSGPLQSAVYTGNKDIVELLLQNGADINFVNHDGYTALMSTNIRNSQSLSQLFTDTSKTEIARLLLKHGADVNIRGGRFQQSALHMACLFENSAMVELLVQHPNTNINIRDAWNLTPLSLMKDRLIFPDKNIIKLLLKYGATD